MKKEIKVCDLCMCEDNLERERYEFLCHQRDDVELRNENVKRDVILCH